MRKNLSELFLNVLGLFFTVALAWIFCQGTAIDLALLAGGRHTTGTVTAVRSATVSYENSANYVVSFRYAIDGREYEGECHTPSYSFFEGMRAEVEVVRGAPGLARMLNTTRSPVGLSGLPMLAFPVFAVGCLLRTLGRCGGWPKIRRESWRRERRWLKKGLASMPRVPIAATATGAQAKVVGRVRAQGKLLCAPFTNQPCVAYSLVLEEDGELLLFDNRCAEFLLEDASGTAIVTDEDLGRSGVLVLPEGKRRQVPVPSGDWFWTKRPTGQIITCRLAVVCDGDIVAVAGLCCRLGPDPAQGTHGYRQMVVSERISVSATATEPLLISKHDPATGKRF